MSDAIRTWLIAIEVYPGWKDWRRERMGYTLYYDDPFPPKRELGHEFVFSEDIEKQHAVIIQYLGLQQTVHALKESEFYFRRYPFRGLPVSRYSHITNVCEMYFGRFYELKERLKNYFEAVKAVTPHPSIEVGAFIKQFGKVFDQELRARNGIHHHGRFEDVAIERVFLTESFSMAREAKGWKGEHLADYRRLANEWAGRVRRRGAQIDEFMEAVAAITLRTCYFLSNPANSD